jgi:hypothetical protein
MNFDQFAQTRRIFWQMNDVADQAIDAQVAAQAGRGHQVTATRRVLREMNAVADRAD